MRGEAESSPSLEGCGSGRAAPGPPGDSAACREGEPAREAWRPGLESRGRAPKAELGDAGSERPDKQLGQNATRSTESRPPWVAERERPRNKEQGAKLRARSRPRRGAPGPGRGRRRGVRFTKRPRARGQSTGSPGSFSPWERAPAPREILEPGPREGHTPNHYRATADAQRNGKKMFLTGTAQLLLCCYPGKENGEWRASDWLAKAAGRPRRWDGRPGSAPRPGCPVPRCTPWNPQPSGLSADAPGKLGKTCWK